MCEGGQGGIRVRCELDGCGNRRMMFGFEVLMLSPLMQQKEGFNRISNCFTTIVSENLVRPNKDPNM